MPKIQAGVADADKFFNLNGVDYIKGLYNIKYNRLVLGNNGEYNPDLIEIGIVEKYHLDNTIQDPSKLETWVDAGDVPYTDLNTLLSDIVTLIGSEPLSGGGSGGSGNSNSISELPYEDPDGVTVIRRVIIDSAGVITEEYLNMDGTPYVGDTSLLKPYVDGCGEIYNGEIKVLQGQTLDLDASLYNSISIELEEFGTYTVDISSNGAVEHYSNRVYQIESKTFADTYQIIPLDTNIIVTVTSCDPFTLPVPTGTFYDNQYDQQYI